MKKKTKLYLKIVVAILIIVILIITGQLKIGLSDDVKRLISYSGNEKILETVSVATPVDKQLNLFVKGMEFNGEPDKNQTIKIEDVKKIEENSYELKFDQPVNYQFYFTDGQEYDLEGTVTEYNEDQTKATVTCKKNCDNIYTYLLMYSTYFDQPYLLIGLEDFGV